MSGVNCESAHCQVPSLFCLSPPPSLTTTTSQLFFSCQCHDLVVVFLVVLVLGHGFVLALFARLCSNLRWCQLTLLVLYNYGTVIAEMIALRETICKKLKKCSTTVCNRRNVHTRKSFVLQHSRTSVHY